MHIPSGPSARFKSGAAVPNSTAGHVWPQDWEGALHSAFPPLLFNTSCPDLRAGLIVCVTATASEFLYTQPEFEPCVCVCVCVCVYMCWAYTIHCTPAWLALLYMHVCVRVVSFEHPPPPPPKWDKDCRWVGTPCPVCVRAAAIVIPFRDAIGPNEPASPLKVTNWSCRNCALGSRDCPEGPTPIHPLSSP